MATAPKSPPQAAERGAATPKNQADLQAANAALQREVQEYRRAEEALVRQSAALSKTTNMLVERDRLLYAFQEIGKAILASLDRDQILDTLARQVVRAGIFRSVMIALVDQKTRSVEVVRNLVCQVVDGRAVPNSPVEAKDDLVGLRYSLDDDNITAEVARSGHLQVLIDWDDRFDRRIDTKAKRRGQVSYFIPVLNGKQVLAVLATGSEVSEKETMLHRLEIMRPLLDQMAIALEHARLYAETQEQTQQLVRLERMRALGEMAVGISHNLNNLLASIMVPAQLLEGASDDPQIQQDTAEIIAATTRASDLVQRLNRAVQTQEGEDLGPIDLNQALEEALAQSRARWQAPAIECRTQLAPVPPVGGLAPELETILTNLLDNAREAMPTGGVLTLTTRPHPDGVELNVIDTGIGMAPEVRQRVFEPFFTSKDEVGPGLGLSMVYNIVTCWGGSVDVQSAPGKGSTFTLILPQWQEKSTRPAPAQTPKAKGRLLLVNGDHQVEHALTQALNPIHKLDVFKTSGPALKALTPGTYDALVVNLEGGDQPGDQFVRQARQIDPSLATVLVDNWSRLDGPALSHADYDFRLQKPIPTTDKILKVIDRALALHGRRTQTGRARS